MAAGKLFSGAVVESSHKIEPQGKRKKQWPGPNGEKGEKVREKEERLE